MSWSINLIGKSENIKKELEAYGKILTGASKEEYDAALPHLNGLLSLNVNETVLEFSANGHAYGNNSNCNCSVKPLSGKLV